jgi:hypothetical protein
MAQTTFNDNVMVDGSQDIQQLRVQGHSTQNQPLQTWETSAGAVQSQISGDGRVIAGDDLGVATPDALLEAHRAETSTARPKRGIHSLGQISGTLNNLIQWMVAELELRGSSAIDALHTGFRVRATNLNTGTPTANAELRGGDIEVIQDTTASSTALPRATGLQVSVTNPTGKTITNAATLRLKMTNAGTITNPYSIYTEGSGVAHFEDYLEVKRPATIPGAGATDFMRVYPKTDGRMYAKNWNNVEVPLSNAAVLLYDNTLAANGTWDVDLSTLPDGLNYTHLELILQGRTNLAATTQAIRLLFNNDSTVANYKSSAIYNNSATAAAIVVTATPVGGYTSAASAPANAFGFTRIFVPFYRATTALHLNRVTSNYQLDTANGIISLTGTHLWSNTAAISRVQIQAINNPTNVFVTNSRLQIIGHRY